MKKVFFKSSSWNDCENYWCSMVLVRVQWIGNLTSQIGFIKLVILNYGLKLWKMIDILWCRWQCSALVICGVVIRVGLQSASLLISPVTGHTKILVKVIIVVICSDHSDHSTGIVYIGLGWNQPSLLIRALPSALSLGGYTKILVK